MLFRKAWDEYESKLACKPGSQLHRLVRISFYTGALSVMETIRKIALIPGITEDQGGEAMKEVNAELQSFMVDVELENMKGSK